MDGAPRFVDLSVFTCALDALITATGDLRDDLISGGVTFLKRYEKEVVLLFDTILTPLMERPEFPSTLDALFRKMTINTSIPVMYQNRAMFFRALYPWLRTHPQAFSMIFQGEDRAGKAARDLSAIVDEESPAAFLNKLSTIAPVSGLSFTKKWLASACTKVGTPLLPIEASLVEAQQAQQLGEALQAAETKVQSARPGTPEAAEAQEERLQVLTDVQTLADESQDPSMVKAIVVGAKAKTVASATVTGRRLGLTPAQEDAMTSRGKTLIAAGAGSGKCVTGETLIPTDKGLIPIRDLAGHLDAEGQEELVMGVFGVDGPEVTSHVYCDGYRQTRRIHTRLGFELEGTGPHRIQVLEGGEIKFKRLDEIQAGEIAVIINLQSCVQALKEWGGQTDAAGLSPNSLTYDEITEITEGEALVYDFVVPGTHTFAGGGFMNHNTRVIAAKVAYHTLELGADTTSILATSFTTKSSAELIARVKSYGVVLEGAALDGFGTTHSICGKVLNRKATAFRRPAYMGRSEGWKQTVLVKLAMAQVKMMSNGMARDPEPRGFWDGRYTEEGSIPAPGGDYAKSIAQALAYYQWAVRTWKGGPGEWASDQMAFLRRIERVPQERLTSRDKSILNMLFGKMKGQHATTFRLASSGDDGQGSAADVAPPPGAKGGGSYNKLDNYQYAKTPAGMWFNIGNPLVIVERNQTRPIPLGEFKNAISILKGKGVTPSQAWVNGGGAYGPRSPHAAVYGAYEWLKSSEGEGEFRGLGDMDDILIDTVTALVAGPQVRKQMQSQYKVVLVDESQDLNKVQHLIFGLISGHLDAKTLKPNEGKMTADTYALIGDDKQCVASDTLIRMADGSERAAKDLVPGDELRVWDRGQLGVGVVRHNVPSGWTEGLRVTTESGHVITMSPNHKLWASEPVTKEGETTKHGVIRLLAHTAAGSQVSCEWTGDSFDKVLADVQGVVTVGDRRRLRRWFKSYREALAFAENLAGITGWCLRQALGGIKTGHGLPKITASALLPGMCIPVMDDGKVSLSQITQIEKVPGAFLDLDVADASNFFGNGVLTSNSIYSFRGAEPNEFIDKSDLVEGGEKFATKLLDTNFRSGQAIVDAANNLIAKNKKQVPMVCQANVDRNGQGAVVVKKSHDTSEAAVTVAEEIKAASDGAIEGSFKYKNFGIAVRSNAEAYSYGLEMLKREIPFKSNVQFFNEPVTKAIIGWMTIAEQGLDGDPARIEAAIRDCVRAPFSRLGSTFFEVLEAKATGSWARWLVDGGSLRVYSNTMMRDALDHFTRNLQYVADLTLGPEALVNRLLDLKGLDDTTITESLILVVEEDDNLMAELLAETDDGTVTPSQIRTRALAPIEPLLGLTHGREDMGSTMTFIRKLRTVNDRLASRDSDAEVDRDAVTIGTAHSWKGLEVPTMFVPMVGGKFPRTRSDGTPVSATDLDDDRRLAYVAITRAEQRCVILSIPHPTMGVTSQFVDEIGCVASDAPDLDEDPGEGFDSDEEQV